MQTCFFDTKWWTSPIFACGWLSALTIGRWSSVTNEPVYLWNHPNRCFWLLHNFLVAPGEPWLFPWHHRQVDISIITLLQSLSEPLAFWGLLKIFILFNFTSDLQERMQNNSPLWQELLSHDWRRCHPCDRQKKRMRQLLWNACPFPLKLSVRNRVFLSRLRSSFPLSNLTNCLSEDLKVFLSLSLTEKDSVQYSKLHAVHCHEQVVMTKKGKKGWNFVRNLKKYQRIVTPGGKRVRAMKNGNLVVILQVLASVCTK